MPNAISHAVVLTDDLDATIAFLTDVCALRTVNRYEPAPTDLASSFGWPVDAQPTRGAVVGEGPGSLDFVEIPSDLRGSVHAGVVMLAIPTANVDGAVDKARAAGLAPQGPKVVEGAGGVRLTMAPVVVGGVGYELVRFG